MTAREHKWFIEETSPQTAHMFGVEQYLECRQTKFQHVEIADTKMFGRILILDGKIQSSQYDEYVYHEALVHPAMLSCEKPRRVLVIGGGEGATVREVLRHPSLEQVVMVDLDREVVEMCREHLTSWHKGCFDDPRVKLVFMDARQYLEENSSMFDVIISDVPETVEASPALKLFTQQYFSLVKSRLAEGGVMALQAGDFSMPFIEAHSLIYNTIRQVMPGAYSYRAYIPSFNTEWAFIIAFPGNGAAPQPDFVDRQIGRRNLELQFLDGETCSYMFALPKDSRQRISKAETVIDDSNLLTSY